MRWRPDLVTAADDDELTPESDRMFDDRYYRSTFRRPDGTWHFRLDDGHRFVGSDVAEEFQDPDGYAAVWERLERELTDPRHTVPAESPARDLLAATWARYGALLDAVVLGPPDIPTPVTPVESDPGFAGASEVPGLPDLAAAAADSGRYENPDTLWGRECPLCGERCEPIQHLGRDFCCWCLALFPGWHMDARVSICEESGARRFRLSAAGRKVGRVLPWSEIVATDNLISLVRTIWADLEVMLAAEVAAAPQPQGPILTPEEIRAAIRGSTNRYETLTRMMPIVPPLNPRDLIRITGV